MDSGYVSPDRLDLEVQRDQAEDQALQVLYQVVHDSQPFWIFAVVDVSQRPDLGGLLSERSADPHQYDDSKGSNGGKDRRGVRAYLETNVFLA